MPEVIALGPANVDVSARVHRFPGADDEVAVKSMENFGGGCSANVAVGVSRLGHSSGFVGLVGTDSFADFIMKEFEREGVETPFVKRVNGNSGMVFAIVNEKGERVLYSSMGVASGMCREDIPLDYIKSAKFLHLGNIEGEGIIEAFELAAREASEAGD